MFELSPSGRKRILAVDHSGIFQCGKTELSLLLLPELLFPPRVSISASFALISANEAILNFPLFAC